MPLVCGDDGAPDDGVDPNTTCGMGCVQDGNSGPPSKQSQSMVGDGQGSYVQETTYRYVGGGKGTHNFEEPEGTTMEECCRALRPTPEMQRSACFMIPCIVVPILLATLLYLLWHEAFSGIAQHRYDCAEEQSTWNWIQHLYCCVEGGEYASSCTMHKVMYSPPAPAPLTMAPTMAPATPAPSSQSNCFVGSHATWDLHKKVFCCVHHHIDCPLTTMSSKPFNCQLGLSNAHDGWSDNKRAWCCSYERLGCMVTTRPVVVLTSEQYDCNAGLANFNVGWSGAKKTWCCQNHKMGCPEAASAPLPYDCNAGYSHWQMGWSVGKKDFCCKNHNKGCAGSGVTSLPFDCDAGYHNCYQCLIRQWSVAKLAWCCHHTGRGCPTTVPPR